MSARNSLFTAPQSRVFDAVLNSIGLGVLVTDLKGNLLFCNHGAISLLGAFDEQTALEDWPSRYGCYLPDKITLCPYEDSPVVRAIRGEEADNVELFFVSPDGGTAGFDCSVNLKPLRGERGEIEGAVLVLQDITERKKLAQEAARSNAALQQFASVAAHDLQEPLRSVVGFVELLTEEAGDQLNEDCKHYMTRINVSMTRMRSLITDLLAFSRIQSKPRVQKLVNCNEVLERSIDSLSASIEESGAKIVVNQLPTIFADAPQIGQLFQNLLANALKFASKERALLVQVSAKREALSWIFSVEDNGIGIDMQFAERIFVLFQRLHGVSAYSGTGIGLAICKGIVDGHGGRIWLQSEPGKGSTFYFSIPVAAHLEENS